MDDSNTLPAIAQKRNIDESTWNALLNSIYPGAKVPSIVMAWDYCHARGLDPLKKPVHIVPMSIYDTQAGDYVWRDIIMPGIYELRTTASRTGQYAGQDDAEFGPVIKYKGVEAPEWCRVTVYRLVHNHRVGFSHTEFFSEAVTVKSKDGSVNAMWSRRPRGQLAKCAEAGALRKAFPEELGGEMTVEEMAGKPIDMGQADVVTDVEIKTPQPKEKPAPQPEAQQESKAAPIDNGERVTESMLRVLQKKLEGGNKTAVDLCQHFKIDAIANLPKAKINEALEWAQS